jgi:hypothetical protein
MIKINKTATFEFIPLITIAWTVLENVSPINVHDSWGVSPFDVTSDF